MGVKEYPKMLYPPDGTQVVVNNSAEEAAVMSRCLQETPVPDLLSPEPGRKPDVESVPAEPGFTHAPLTVEQAAGEPEPVAELSADEPVAAPKPNGMTDEERREDRNRKAREKRAAEKAARE